jgi:hypothetical protein
MNSGYHWPYGRREGVLPVWAQRRASAPGAVPFPRIIFQRRPEGYASRTCEDSTRDSYFCLSFSSESTRREGLDAITCASAFNSDKGRIMKAEDVAAGYTEPASVGGPPTWQAGDRVLGMTSLYPPRARLRHLRRSDHGEPVHERQQLLPGPPRRGAVSPASRVRSCPTSTRSRWRRRPRPGADVMFSVPSAWPEGEYIAYFEINTEGD